MESTSKSNLFDSTMAGLKHNFLGFVKSAQLQLAFSDPKLLRLV